MKQLIKLITIFCFAGLLVSCEKQDFSYDGSLRVEFSANANSQYYNPRFYYHNYNVAPTLGSYTLQVQLIGGQQNKALTVNYKVVPEVYFLVAVNRVVTEKPTEGTEGKDYFTLRTTAVQGTDFTLTDGSTTIPANSSFGQITMNINVNNNVNKRVLVVLQDSSDLIANGQSKIMMVILGRLSSANPPIF